jgi:hypothetical protein
MNRLVPIGSAELPALVSAIDERASIRFFKFSAANIRNLHTRRAYYYAAEDVWPGRRRYRFGLAATPMTNFFESLFPETVDVLLFCI